MKKLIYILILLFVFFQMYSNEIKNYEYLFLKIIPVGKEEGNIGFLKKIVSGMPRSARAISISKEGNIYIPDFANSRINVYDLKLNYVKTIIENKNKEIHNATKLFIDDNNNIIEIASGMGLKKINHQGETILFLNENELAKNIKRDDFFIFRNEILYYDDTGSIRSITSEGVKRNSLETLNSIRELEKIEINNVKLEGQKLLNSKRNIIIDFQNKEKYIIIGDNYYTSSFLDMREYFKKTVEYYAVKKELKNEIKRENINIDEKSFEICKFIGFDSEHNSYWRSSDQSQKKWKEFIFIYSNYGEVIDAFYFEELKDKNVIWGDLIRIAVAPSGDVYFMRNDETGSYFWKVERRW